tara:strand:+ start:62 stop:673 length:612 start_codon:yes stop_codon:yes gene_type:complete
MEINRQLVEQKMHEIRGKCPKDWGGNSYIELKYETAVFVEDNYPDKNITILDVGPGSGQYNGLLKELLGYNNIDCVEIHEPHVDVYNYKERYRNVYIQNILEFDFDYYDIIIMGDVLEHIKVDDAIKLVKKLSQKCSNLIIQVPYLYAQDAVCGNAYEKHEQPDLTNEVFLKRYPMMTLLAQAHTTFGGTGVYCYKREDNDSE